MDGFSHFYGEQTNNMAEFLALKDGLNLCKQRNISPVIIESDSLVVVTAVRLAKSDN